MAQKQDMVTRGMTRWYEMSNVVTIGMTKKGQFLTTFPRGIANAMRLEKGSKVKFLFDRGDVIVRKIWE